MNRFIAAASSFSLAVAGLGLSVALPIAPAHATIGQLITDFCKTYVPDDFGKCVSDLQKSNPNVSQLCSLYYAQYFPSQGQCVKALNEFTRS